MDFKTKLLLSLIFVAFIVISEDLTSELAQEKNELDYVCEAIDDIDILSLSFSPIIIEPPKYIAEIIILYENILYQNPALFITSDRAPPLSS